MSGKGLNPYRGRLKPSEITAGINAAISNAQRLLNDAKLLYQNKSYPSAASLTILSIEEAGKVTILRQMAVVQSDKDIKDCWRNYRSHIKKNAMWAIMDFVKRGANKLDDFIGLFEEGADHTYIIDQIKQLGFYSDCLGKINWSVPDEVVDESITGTLIKIAEILTPNKIVSETEIELWIKHLGPVWNKDAMWMRKALENWYEDMQKHGLAPEGSNKMKDFIQTGNISTDLEV